MFRRKLKALGHHHSEEFDINDQKDFRTLVLWLEDQKIRFYPSESRRALREVDSSNWQDAFTKYLRDLECPVDFRKEAPVLDWLLGYAIQLEYSDSASLYQTLAKAAHQAQEPVTSDPSLAKLDPHSAEFQAGVTSLAKLLQLPAHTDQVKLFQAAGKLIEDRFSKAALASAASQSSEATEVFPLDKMDLGFDTHDKALNQAAKVLRLLHIAELRLLQTNINEIIVAVQTLTANPKTDDRLGKVGR